MDINQNQQTNTFHKGMDTDTSDVLLGSDQYRYAENLRITVDGSGANGDLHTIEGTDHIDSITRKFDGEDVLTFSSIRNICVAVLYNKNNKTWRIVKWNGDTLYEDNFVIVFGPCSTPIWKTYEVEENGETRIEGEPELKTLSTVLRWESEKNVKLYIADGIHELISININDTDYPFSVNENNPKITVDNVFEQAFSYQGNGLPLMTATLLDAGGSLKPAIVQYAYRLYIQNGSASDMSPLTKPIYLLKNSYEGYRDTDVTSKSVKLSFDETTVTGNLYIQIYRINYQKNGQLPAVNIITDEPFTSKMVVTDFGQSIESVSAAEFLSELDTHIIPKIIESKGDIMYAANIKDGMAESGEAFSKFDATSYSAGNIYNSSLIFPKNDSGVYTFDDINFDEYNDRTRLRHKQFSENNEVAVWNKEYWSPIYKRYLNISGTTGDEIDASILSYYVENNIPVYLQITNPYQNLISPLQVEIGIIYIQIESLQGQKNTSTEDEQIQEQLQEQIDQLRDQIQDKEAQISELMLYEKGVAEIHGSYIRKVENDQGEFVDQEYNFVTSAQTDLTDKNIISKIRKEVEYVEKDLKEDFGEDNIKDVIVKKYKILPSIRPTGPDENPIPSTTYNLTGSVEYYNGVGKYIKWRYVLNDNENPKYRSGEVYRFGIVLYDEHGKASPAKWIADIMIPDYYNIDQEESSIHYNYHIGIEFFVDIPKELNCSAYDIVRCDRDFDSRYTLFQGLVGFTTCDDEDTCIYNPGFFTMDKVLTTRNARVVRNVDKDAYNYIPKDSSLYFVGDGPSKRLLPYTVKQNLLMFACPEYCYNHTQVEDILSKYGSDKLQVQIIDRRDVSCQYGKSNGYGKNAAYKRYGSDTPIIKLIDDDRMWVHSSAPNINDNRMDRLEYAGLGFKWGHPSEIDACLDLNAGFIGLQSRVDLFSQSSDEHEQSLLDGTWEGNLPMARLEPGEEALRTCVFFNWFGQHEYPDDEYNWHNVSSSVLEEKNGEKIYSHSYPITSITYATAREWDQFLDKSADKFQITAFDQTVPVELYDGNMSFINWSLGSLNKRKIDESYLYNERISKTWMYPTPDYQRCISFYSPLSTEDNWYASPASWEDIYANCTWYPISGGDDLLLLSLGNEAVRYNLNDAKQPTSPRIYIANIKQAAVPYQGYNDPAIKRSKFYSFGNYVSLSDYEDTGDGILHTQIKIGGGDTFVTHFKYNAAHWWTHSRWNSQIAKMCTFYDTVIETDVNLDAQCGYLYRTGRGYTEGEYKLQHLAVDQIGAGKYTQVNDSYRYNSGYSCRPNLIPKTSDNKTAGETDTYDTRIQYSNRKTNNESIDSWMDFKSNNFLDVDTRFGEITDLKLFKDKLIFWQNNATGIISTNERTILQNTDDASIILGDGSVLQRFDYVSQTYGQKPNQHTACITNNNLYWWDEYRKEILHYMEGYNVSPLGTVKLVKNYLSSRQPVSVPSISYDVDNNEVICHVVYDGDTEDQALIFNEAVQVFTGVYKFSPIFYAMCMDKLFMIGKDETGTDTLYQYGVKQDNILLFDRAVFPKVKFIVNKASDYTKTFDIQLFGGKFYGGGSQDETPVKRNNIYDTHRITEALNPITFAYKTPLKQHAYINGENAITNAEYDFRLTIPRDGEGDTENPFDKQKQWGNRLRGKLMEVELSSNSNNSDFALHYITTKYRMSWN